MKQKVLLCVNSDIGRGNTIGFRFTKIAYELSRQGTPYTIIARANYSKDLSAITPFYKNFLGRMLYALHSYLTPGISYRFIDAFLFDVFVWLTLKTQKKDFTVAHFGEYAPRSIKYLKKKGVTVFLDVPIGHNAYADYLLTLGIKSDKQFFDPSAFIDQAMLAADCLVVPSNFVKETLGYAKITTPTKVIPFGADRRNRSLAKKANGSFTFMFAGSVSMRKGILYLLQAWNELKFSNARLIICGRVYREIYKEITEFENKNVQFVGFSDLKPFFEQSHVFVFPSLFEGSAKVVYEAMAHGLPVITTPNAGSIIDDAESGFIVPIADVQSLIDKMRFLYNNPQQAIAMGDKAYAKVAAYSWERYAQAVAGLYTSLKI